jgi:hypothetical protein
MDQELSDCIRAALVALLYDPSYIVVADRASLGADRQLCGFRGETEPGTASLKLTVAALIGSMHEILRGAQQKYVWFDVRACRKAPTGPGGADNPHVWDIMSLLGVAETLSTPT